MEPQREDVGRVGAAAIKHYPRMLGEFLNFISRQRRKGRDLWLGHAAMHLFPALEEHALVGDLESDGNPQLLRHLTGVAALLMLQESLIHFSEGVQLEGLATRL